MSEKEPQMSRILKEPVFWVDPKEIKHVANMWPDYLSLEKITGAYDL